MIPKLLAALPLEKKYQENIARIGDNETKRILAHSSHIDPSVAARLSSDPDYITRTYALRFCSDPDLVEEKYIKHANNAKIRLELARNVALPHKYAARLLDDPDPAVVFAGFTHPNVSVTEKKQKLTPSLANSLVNRGACVGDRVVKAYELLFSNPYILDSIDRWDHYLKRASLGVSFTNIDHVDYLKETKFKGLTNDKYATLCAILKNTDTLTTDYLISLGDPLADLLVVTDPSTSFEQASNILSDTGKIKKNVGPEPHIIGRVVQRFGSSILFNAREISDTRIRTASFTHPQVQYYNSLRKLTKEVLEIPEILGTDLTAWDNFYQLSKTWGKDLISLAHASVRI